MSSKKRNREKPGINLPEIISRELSKGNFKDALKDAKVCYRKDPSEPNRQLLQRAHILRAKQLYQSQLLDQSRQCLAEAMELGSVPAELKSELGQLAVMLDVGTGNSSAAVELDAKALRALADHVVVSGTEPKGLVSDIRDGARRVRAALEAIEYDRIDEANQFLSDVDRDSHFMDWKLFARGLAAYYRQDFERMTSNWQRLDRGRPAFRIAQPLMAISGSDNAQPISSSVEMAVREVEKVATEGRFVTILKSIVREFESDRWSALSVQVRELVKHCRDTDPQLIQHVVDTLWRQPVRQGDRQNLDKLIQAAPGPANDPNWNRARALCEENSHQLSVAKCEKLWLKYLNDLDTLPHLSNRDREIGKGLIYARVATHYADEAHEYSRRFYFDEEDEEVVNRNRQLAISNFERSLKHAPQLVEVYRRYAHLLDIVGESEKAFKVREDFCQRFPDNFDGLIDMARYCLAKERAEKAKVFAERAFKLRPRDSKTIELLREISLAMAREFIISGNMAMARDSLDATEHQALDEAAATTVVALRAVLEFKSSNTKAADEYVSSAIKKLEEPAGGAFIVAAEASRCGVPAEVKSKLNDRLRSSIGKKCGSQSAGIMTSYLTMLYDERYTYPDIELHEKLLANYLARCSRVRWQAKDLRSVCDYLIDIPEQLGLLTKMLSTANRQFPNDPHFNVLKGRAEIAKGPRDGDLEFARDCFKDAIEKSKTQNTPLDEEYLEMAQRNLAYLDHLGVGRFRPAFFGGFDPRYEDDEYEDEYDDEDDDFDDDEEEYDDDYDDDPEYGEAAAGGPSLDELNLPDWLRKEAERVAKIMGMSLPEMLERLRNGDLPGGPAGRSSRKTSNQKK
jgi:hypothetical protein